LNFFDTNLVVAASLPSHVHHEACHARLALIRESGCACAAHSMAEAFSVLTRMPVPYRFPVAEAMRIVEYTMEYSTLVALTEIETVATLRSLAASGFGGGLIFDALLIACARKIGAKAIYTTNFKHFRRIAPDLASVIFEP
jgi:predicted nucleic acid-binding protein